MTTWTSDFFRQNEWANLALIEVCRPLSDEQLDATVPGTYGSVRDTLVHVVSAEGGYAFRLGHEPAPRLMRGAAWPGFDALAQMVSAAADALVAAADTDPTRVIRVGADDEPFDVEAGVILIQAFHHGTEHRGQVCAILTSLGIIPPELSSWEWGLAVGRMRSV
jgi:uncharacterized damage-inducible protein DinB